MKVFPNRSSGDIVHAHNEERLVSASIEAMPTFVDPVVAVDHVSSDPIYSRGREVASSDDRLVTIRHRENRGVGAAVVTGYTLALDAGVDVVFVMDGDGQMGP